MADETSLSNSVAEANPLEIFDTISKTIEFENLASPIQVAIFLGAMTLLTTAMVSITSFTRIVIVLSFVRRALTVQEIPPNPTLIGFALFMTLFTMGPVLDQINAKAITPYMKSTKEDEFTATQAIRAATSEMQRFMLKHTRKNDLMLFIKLSRTKSPNLPEDTKMRVLIPAFMISELKTAFIMGFCIYIPFILIDLLVSTILMSLGMMMMPPVVVSAPLKLMLFVLVDGWHLVAYVLGHGFA